jgi:hypothetical protein
MPSKRKTEFSINSANSGIDSHGNKVEWDDYRMTIHPYELEKFLPIL